MFAALAASLRRAALPLTSHFCSAALPAHCPSIRSRRPPADPPPSPLPTPTLIGQPAAAPLTSRSAAPADVAPPASAPALGQRAADSRRPTRSEGSAETDAAAASGDCSGSGGCGGGGLRPRPPARRPSQCSRRRRPIVSRSCSPSSPAVCRLHDHSRSHNHSCYFCCSRRCTSHSTRAAGSCWPCAAGAKWRRARRSSQLGLQSERAGRGDGHISCSRSSNGRGGGST